MSKKQVTMELLIPKLGNSKIEMENIFETMLIICPMFSALKNIQAKTVNPKVNKIEENSLNVGNNFPFATISI